MHTLKKRVSFYDSEEGLQIKEILQTMSHDRLYNTESSYSADTSSYPDNVIPFVDKHMAYLNTHPSIDPNQYIANLRLMTRIR